MEKKIFLTFILILFTLFITYNKVSNTKTRTASNAVFSNNQKNKDFPPIGIDSIKKLFNSKEYSSALKYALSALDHSKRSKKVTLSFKLNNIIGDIFREIRSYEKAISYYNKALYLNSKIKSSREQYTENRSIPHHIETNYLRIILKKGAAHHSLDHIDSAKYFYKKLIENSLTNNKALYLKSKAYNNLSNLSYYYPKERDYKKAEEYALKAINIKEKLGDKASQAASIASLASIYIEQEQYEKARKFYLKAVNLIEDNNDLKSLRFKEVFFENLSWAMYNQKNYKAYDYLDRSINLRDSLKDTEINEILLNIENKHKENLENQKISLVKNQTTLLQQRKTVTTYLFAAITLLTLVISAVVIYNIRLRQRNLKLKLEQSKLVEKQKIDHLKSEAQVKILNAAIDGKETERKQIAETLHDSVSALLSSANMHLHASKRQFNGEIPIELQKAQEIILEASQKVRDLSHNLVSPVLLKFGLGYAIKDIAKKYSNIELEFHAEITNINRYNQEFEIKLYNVIHELINNILKHSRASNAYVILTDQNNFLSVRIEDDGIGFDCTERNSSRNKGGLGLNQVEARIQMMNGNFLVESRLDEGSKITFSVPVQNNLQTNFVYPTQ